MAGADEQRETWGAFREVVNMTPSALEKWLATEDSRAAGQHKDGGESTGHASGRAIVEILRKKKGDLSEADYAHMRKVVGYVRRHLAQRPSGGRPGHTVAPLVDELGPRPPPGRVSPSPPAPRGTPGAVPRDGDPRRLPTVE